MLKNVSILGIARTVSIAFAFAQSVIVARILGPEAFGTFALITAYPSLIFGILNVRTTETTTRFLAGFDARGAHARALSLCQFSYGIDLAVAILAFAVVALTASWIGPHILDDVRLVPLTVVYALSFVSNAFVSSSSGILVVTGKFWLTGGLDMAGATLRAGLVVALVMMGLGIPGVVYGVVVGNAVLGVSMLVAAHRVAAVRWGASWLRSGWAELAGQRREIARFFVFSDLTALLGVAIKNADILILASFRPPLEIGYYHLGKSITNQLLSLVSAIRVVAFPQVMRMWAQGEWHAMWRFVHSHMWTIGVPGTVLVGVLALVIEPTIELVYGPQFASATLVTRLLLLQVGLLLLFLWIGMVLTAWGDIHVLLAARAVGSLLVLTIIVVFAPRWGIAAAGIALPFQQALTVLITVMWVYSHRATRKQEAADRLMTRAIPAVP